MANYRAARARFQRQSAQDWDELLTAARARCHTEALPVAATLRRDYDAHAMSGIDSFTVGAPDLADWSKSLLELPRVTGYASILQSGSNNNEVVARKGCTNSSSLWMRRYPRGRGVEAQLRAVLQQALMEHTVDSVARFGQL